jgi:hypothetical protein
MVATYNPTTQTICTVGGTVVSSSIGNSFGGLNSVNFGYSNLGYINGYVKKFSYYPQAVSSTNLQALTGS